MHCLLALEYACTETENVGIVVRARHDSRVFIVTRSGTDAAHLVGAHAHPQPGAADEDASLGSAVSDSLRCFQGEVGIVAALV